MSDFEKLYYDNVDWCAKCGAEHSYGSLKPCDKCGGKIFYKVKTKNGYEDIERDK